MKRILDACSFDRTRGLDASSAGGSFTKRFEHDLIPQVPRLKRGPWL